MHGTVEKAKASDVQGLIELYRSVYGDTYPVIYGRDPEAALKLILSPTDYWYIIRDPKTQNPIASAIANIDEDVKIGQIIAVAVHPDFSGKGLASSLVSQLCDDVFSSAHSPRSLFATTRTVSQAPQKIFLRNKFLPMGVLPNSHFINGFESLTFFVRHQDHIAKELHLTSPMMKLFELQLIQPSQSLKPIQACELEAVENQKYIDERFGRAFKTPYDRYYPFHKPNLILTSISKGTEIFLNINHKDRYSALIAGTRPWIQMKPELAGLFAALEHSGLSYVECIIPLQNKESMSTMIDFGFIPCAIYPSMMPDFNNKLSDYVILSKTFEKLSLVQAKIHNSFRPYVDHYMERALHEP